jgi:hypothetical protein
VDIIAAPVTLPLWVFVGCVLSTGALCFVFGVLGGNPLRRRPKRV